MTPNNLPLFRNAYWLIIDKLIRIVGGLIVGVWLARYLGPQDFGVLSYGLAYIGFFTVFVNLGLEQLVVKELVNSPIESNLILGSAFILKLAGAVFAISVVVVSLLFSDVNSITKIVIIAFSIGFIAQSFDVIDYFFQAKVMSKRVVIARDIAFILFSVIKVFLILAEFDVEYFAIASSLELFVTALFLYITYKSSEVITSKWQFSRQYSVKLLRQSWPIAISIFLISIHTKIDQIMIGNILNHAEVGIYSVALKFSEFYYFIPAIILSTFLPYLTNLANNDREKYSQRLLELYSLMFWLGAAQTLFMFAFGESLINLFFGSVYNSAYHALIFTACTGIFVGQATIRWMWMLNENLQKFRLYNNFIAVIINIVLNLILIPKIGIVGAAIATLLTQVISTWVTSLLWKPVRKTTITMLKSINPMILMALIAELFFPRLRRTKN